MYEQSIYVQLAVKQLTNETIKFRNLKFGLYSYSNLREDLSKFLRERDKTGFSILNLKLRGKTGNKKNVIPHLDKEK